MRKELFATLMLACAVPFTGAFDAFAAPEPQSQTQGVETITGTILDENQEPIIGASVVQKGVKANAVATDFDGNFTIRVPKGAKLAISYVGYKSIEMPASQGMKVYMQPTTEVLNELVAVGYGSQKKANLTGAVATVDVARVMDSRPVQDVARALQGEVPGLTITSNNGDFSESPTIRLRGVGTLSNGQSSSPLIVVDGMTVSDLSYLNPNDIAEISVLKDAASSAIYGARASFGVILITTKKGAKQDKVSLNYNNNFAWNTATDYPDYAPTAVDLTTSLQSYARKIGSYEAFGMNYWDVIPYAEAWYKQHGGKKYTDVVELKPFESWDNVGDYAILTGADGKPYWLRYADWNTGKTLFQTAPAQKHNVSLEGTSGKTTYRLSFGYDAKEGLMRYNPEKMSRYMANASIQTELFSFLKTGARFSFSDREFKSPSLQRNSYQYMWRFPSYFETYGYVRDEDGNPMYFRNEMGIRNGSNVDQTINTQTRMQAWITATLAPGLTLQADYNYNLQNMNSNAAYTPFTTWNNWTATPFTTWTSVAQAGTYAAESNSRGTMWTANIFATYEKEFNKAHNLKIMAGWTGERETYHQFYAKRTGLTDYSLPNINLTDGTTYTTSGSAWRRAVAGFFGRVNYDYKGIYLLEANGRYDGSSRFPAHDQWAFFPSFSAGYRFSEEGYFAPIKDIVSNGKLRASRGHIGNEGIGNFRFLSTVGQVGAGSVTWLNNGQKISEFSMPTLVSNSLTWERIVTTDVGLDLGFFQNAVNLGFDVYKRDTKDMLARGADLPAVLGVGAPYQNNGELSSRGWELSLGWNHSFGDADVFANFSLSDSRTKIEKWSNASGIRYTYNPDPDNGNYTPGFYYGDILGFETDRYFEESDFKGKDAKGNWIYADGVADQSGLQNIKNFVYGPGDVKYKDLNGDGVINEKDIKIIGNAMPRYEYSFRFGGAFKGFDLDIFLQGVGKRNMWATGSLMVPMAAANLGTFEHQQSYNRYILDVNEQTHTYDIVGYDVNQSNDYPNMVSGTGAISGTIQNIGLGTGNFYPQTRYMLDLSYLRVKSVVFGYTIPANITQKALIQKARVYFSGENLFFLHSGTRKIHMDPEISRGYGSVTNDGVGGFGRTVPMMRTLSCGLQVTF